MRSVIIYYYAGVLKISCNDRLWKQLLEAALPREDLIQLINLDEEEDGAYCRALALEHRMDFTVDEVTSYGLFKRPGWVTSMVNLFPLVPKE